MNRKTMELSPPIGVRLVEADRAILERIARDRGIKPSILLRMLIRDWLRDHAEVPER